MEKHNSNNGGSGKSPVRSPNKSGSGAGGAGGGGQTIIPMSRVKTIMKSSPEIANINPDTLFLVCKATELFIETFSIEAFKRSRKSMELEYDNLAQLVDKDDRFQFLSEIVPFKMKAKEALKLIQDAEKRN